MKYRKAFSREHRLIEIINKISTEKGVTSTTVVTATEVARWLDISATQSRKLLNHLVAEGVMATGKQGYPGCIGYRVLYSFSKDYVDGVAQKKFRAEPKPKRTIKINGAQMEVGL